MEVDTTPDPLASVGTGENAETAMEDNSNINATQRESCNSTAAATTATTTAGINGNHSSRETEATPQAPEGKTESTTTATIDQDDERDQNYRGNLLELAQFLTMYRSYYEYGSPGRNAADERGSSLEDAVVTPADIEAGLQYRYLLREKEYLWDEIDTLDVDDETESDAADKGGASEQNSSIKSTRKKSGRWNYLKERLQEKEEHLTDPTNVRRKQMHELLQRFEVWSTKDVAHALFMPPCDCKNIEEAKSACWSKLLHIPSAAYFSSRWPKPHLEGAMDTEATQNANTAGGSSDTPNVQDDKNGCKSKTQTTQVSPTLFSNAYRKAHNATAGHPMCSLVVPPNAYTWEEYARIAEMISRSLHTKEARLAAANSPCAGAINTIQSTRPSIYTLRNRSSIEAGTTANKVNIYAVDFSFQPHDLVALWVRSQHDMTAWRHLVQLFTCHTYLEAGRDHNQRDNEELRGPFQLKYVGNHTSTKRRVLAESALVERLRWWSTLNHVFFHYHFVRYQIEVTPGTSTSISKRRDHENGTLDFSLPPPPAKRMRAEDGNPVSTPGRDPAIIMLEDCYRYLLRWFCRRNQEKVAILFSTDQTLNLAQNSHYENEDFAFWQQCKDANLSGKIYKRLKEYASSGGTEMNLCRSFARLDRRIRKGQYAPQSDDSMGDDGKKTPFYLAVNSMLRAWKECISEESIIIDESELNSVVDDFDQMYEAFHKTFRENGIHAAAASLLDLDSSGDANSEKLAVDVTDGEVVKQLLLGINAPWNEMCTQCMKACSQHEGQSAATSCACCEQLFHADCYKLSYFKQISVRSLVKEMLPFDLFSVEVPQTDSVTDFSGPTAAKVCWTDLTLALKRPFDENQKMERLGISLRQTEPCVEAFKYLKSGSLSLQELFDEDLAVQYPLGFDREIVGCLVTHVTEGGSGDRAGLRKNDVLVAVDNLQGAGIQRFAGLERKDRLELLMVKSEEVKLLIKRPNVDLVASTLKWVKEVRLHNQCLFDLSQKSFSICCEGNCQRGRQPFSESEPETEKIRMDAMNARAVIRRIGMESYAYAFLDEEGFSGISRTSQKSDPTFVSLRRLDAMMSWIICDSTKTSRPVSPEMQLLRNSFFKPAWFSPEKERLDWAPLELEKNPIMLLLSGMGILLCQVGQGGEDGGHDSLFPSFKRRRLAMLTHFIQLYASWSQGLPLLTLNARVPWTAKSCVGCFARTGKRSHCGQWVCNSVQCFRQVMEANAPGAEIMKYDDCAKLVGTSILVYPDDPLLSRVREKAKLRLDSFGRPVEFLIAFYFPQMRCDEDGVFFLLPVISQQQLRFLIDRLSILKQPEDLLNKQSLGLWMEDSILSLEGVLRLNPRALQAKIAETNSFFEKAGKVITKMERQITELAEPSFFRVLSGSKNSGKSDVQIYVGACVDQCSRILRSMSEASTPTMQLMVDKSRDTSDPVFQDQSNSSNCSEDICVWSGKRKVGQDCERMNLRADGAEGMPTLKIDSFCMPTSVAPYTLVYSDLYGTSEGERRNLDKILGDAEELNSSVSGDHEEVAIERIVLTRPNDTLDVDQHVYAGVGWGMEMIKWNLDRRIRVSRVHPNSPAARCGIKPRDCIIEINGRPCDGRTRWTLPFFISSILASPFTPSAGCRKQEGTLQIISSVLRTLRSPVVGPVVLTVQRPIPSKSRNIQVAPVEPSTIARGQRRALDSTIEQEDSRRFDVSTVGTTAASNTLQNSNLIRQLSDKLSQAVDTARTNSEGGQPSQAVVAGNSSTAPVNTYTSVQEMRQFIMGDDGMVALKRLSIAVQPSLKKREFFQARHLYEASKVPDTVLTQLEAAVILEGIHRDMPMMACRLICPRYSLQSIVRQVISLQARLDYLETIPKLERSLWDKLLLCDYKRFTKEPNDAPIVFTDRVDLRFAMPTEKLPLDRMGEEYFRKLVAKKKLLEEHQNRAQQQSSQITGQQQLVFGQPPVQANVRLPQQRQAPVQQFHHRAPNQVNVLQPPVQNPAYDILPRTFQQTNHQYPVIAPRSQGNPYYGGYGPSERIRGGGGEPSLSENETPLENHPLNEWHNTLVYYDNDNEEIWGYIRAPIEFLPPTVADIEEVSVAFFYGTKRGVFADPLDLAVDPLDLTVINNDNDRAQQAQKISIQFGVLQKVIAKQKGRSDADKNEQQQSEEDVSENVGTETKVHADLGVTKQKNTASQIETLPNPNQTEQDLSSRLTNHQPFHVPNGQHSATGCPVTSTLPTIYQEASTKLIHQQLGSMGGPLSPLGLLVDGRTVLWLPTDPVALYVQILEAEHSASPITRKAFRDCVMRQNRLRSSSERLISSSDATHCCLWGCTFERTDDAGGFELAHFTEIAHLHKHNFRFHSFSGGSGESVTRVAPLAGFSRIATTDGIKNLVSGLTAAACARSALLCKAQKSPASALVDPTGENVVNSPSNYKYHLTADELCDFLGGKPEDLAGKGVIMKQDPVVQAALLLLKMSLLFDVAGDTLRLTKYAYESFCACMSKDIPNGGALSPPSCCCTEPGGSISCSLCTLDCEEVLQVITTRSESKMDSASEKLELTELATYSYQGIGCAKPGNVARPRPEKSKACTNGSLSYAKELLLQLWKSIPPQLRGRNTIGSTKKATLGELCFQDLCKQLWKTGGSRDFHNFVIQSSSVEMLGQAFIVLLASFQTRKLPLWWSGEAGWSSFGGSVLRSRASLILRIVLCDVALREYLHTAPEETPLQNLDITTKASFRNVSIHEKMRLLLKIAEGIPGLERYCGIHESLCSICEDGGSLLCCEFCPSVVHSSCCIPTVPESIDNWCCDSCAASITHLGLVAPFS